MLGVVFRDEDLTGSEEKGTNLILVPKLLLCYTSEVMIADIDSGYWRGSKAIFPWCR